MTRITQINGAPFYWDDDTQQWSSVDSLRDQKDMLVYELEEALYLLKRGEVTGKGAATRRAMRRAMRRMARAIKRYSLPPQLLSSGR